MSVAAMKMDFRVGEIRFESINISEPIEGKDYRDPSLRKSHLPTDYAWTILPQCHKHKTSMVAK